MSRSGPEKRVITVLEHGVLGFQRHIVVVLVLQAAHGGVGPDIILIHNLFFVTPSLYQVNRLPSIESWTSSRFK